MGGWIPAAIQGASDLGGAFVAAESNRRRSHEANTLALQEAEKNRQMQYEFAQNGIRWRAEDARAAGLSPLAAMGFGGASASGGGAAFVGESGDEYGRAIASMGQNVAKAISMQETEDEKAERAMRLAEVASRIQENDMRSQLLNWQIEQIRRDLNKTPTFPREAGSVKVMPDEQISRDETDSAKSASTGTPMFKRYNFLGKYGVDIPYSQEGPAEGMEGTGALIMTILRNGLIRPAMYGERKVKQVSDHFRKSTFEYTNKVNDPYGLISTETR